MRVCPECYGLHGPDQHLCPKDGTPTVHYTEVLIGCNLGPYVVRSLISEGGMGVVYAGEHPTLGRRVALKVLRPELSLRDDIVERFTQEARAVNTIGHKNIVNIYDFGKTPFGSFYIVMEYLDGVTLRRLLDEHGPQPLERVAKVLNEVSDALAAAHEKGFIHRDVKPENIMIHTKSGGEYVKLLDFGIAKLLTGDEETETGNVMGTPQYMSPEQLDDQPIDYRCDIFALGVLIYELVTGQVPFPGNTAAAVRQAQITRNPVPPSLCRRDLAIAPSLDDAMKRALALDKDERLQHVGDFAQAFQFGLAETLAGKGRRGVGSRASYILATVFLVLGLGAIGFYTISKKGSNTVTPPTNTIAKPPPPKPESITRKTAPKLARKLVHEQLNHDDAAAREKALGLLRRVRPPSAVSLIVGRLADKRPTLRRQAALILPMLKRKDPKALAELAKRAKRETKWQAVAVLKAMALMGDRSAIPPLRKQIKLARALPLKRYAMVAFADISGTAPPGFDKAIASLTWKSAPEKASALRVLARSGDQAAREELIKSSNNGKLGLQQRLFAARALLDLDRTVAKTAFEKLLADAGPDPSTARTQIAGELLRLGDADKLAILLEYVHSKDKIEARAEAMLELGRARAAGVDLGQKAGDVQDALIAALRRTDEYEKLVAAVALLAF